MTDKQDDCVLREPADRAEQVNASASGTNASQMSYVASAPAGKNHSVRGMGSHSLRDKEQLRCEGGWLRVSRARLPVCRRSKTVKSKPVKSKPVKSKPEPGER